MLKLSQLSLRRGSKLLFSDVSLQIHPRQRVGITGANGTGKSSLYALIRGELHADAGECEWPRDWVLAHVAQETPADARPAIEYVMDGDGELRTVQAELTQAETAHDGVRVALLHSRLDAIGGYSAEARAGRLLHGLGFSPGEEARPVNTFSGGWRMRLNLAQALMCRSDLLLLDEPTNHLDLDAVIWLEEWLRRYPGTLLLISHDRDFLDATVDHIAHIEQGGMSLYAGNYSAFERCRAERLAGQQAAYLKQQREIAHMQRFVERFRAKATKARQAQSRLKALERMEFIAPAHVDSPFHFAFRQPRKNPDPLLRLEAADLGYGEEPLLRGLNLQISPGDRIGLLGPNGAGKTTLIRLLAGEHPLMAGHRHTAQDLAIGYFAQHQLEQLDPNASALVHVQRLDGKATEQALRDFLGGFGFRGEQCDCPVAPFSGGEKARLVLALVVYQQPNLLLLDEPTNHLDLEMRHALGLALQEFAGAVVLVSHDRHLLRITADQLLLVDDGRVEPFAGDLDDYPRWLAERRNAQRAVEVEARPSEHSAAGRKERKRQEAEQRRQLQPLRKEVGDWEQRVEVLGQETRQFEASLADPTLYQDSKKDELARLLAAKASVAKQLVQAETAWMEAMERLDTMEQELNQ